MARRGRPPKTKTNYSPVKVLALGFILVGMIYVTQYKAAPEDSVISSENNNIIVENTEREEKINESASIINSLQDISRNEDDQILSSEEVLFGVE